MLELDSIQLGFNPTLMWRQRHDKGATIPQVVSSCSAITLILERYFSALSGFEGDFKA